LSFLLDTDTGSIHIKRPSGLTHRFVQHSGRLFIPTIVLGELYTWAYRRPDSALMVERIEKNLLSDVTVLDFDSRCALEFGRTRGELLQKGICVAHIGLLIAAVALAHDLILVTHNTADFQRIPALRMEDWVS